MFQNGCGLIQWLSGEEGLGATTLKNILQLVNEIQRVTGSNHWYSK